VDGILLDQGVSSFQLESEDRGFGFMTDSPLDMRMDRRQKLTAADLVNHLDEFALARIIHEFGEEPASRRIARRIVRSRAQSPIRTTGELAAIVAQAVRRPGSGGHRRHEATRTFQALRIAVNNELRGLDTLLVDLVPYLQVKARMLTLSFHSLEDRIVKKTFLKLSGRCVCGLPAAYCQCDRQAITRIVTVRPLVPSAEEMARNPRSRSAKLRCIEKLPAEAGV
jgi:16S rRNA (cytosine1402-N4)-methyltransferase